MEAVKMVGLKRLIRRRWSLRDYVVGSVAEKLHCHCPVPSHHLARLTPKRFLDLHQFGNKEAIEKERARLGDEMNRGYFADMAEFKQHGGKVAVANKVIIPAMEAIKFPDFEVSFSDGKTMKLPIRVSDSALDSDKSSVPKASLVCLSFRASSQEMINSWSVPFVEAYRKSKDVHLYQVSFIDSWLLCRPPIKCLLLWTMKKPNHHESKDTLQKQMVYSFGDHYYFRKELKILNLLTGYIFLLDNFGRVRWQGFGLATEDELSSLLSCTSLLLDEK
ncbi:mitochondrial inner membrane [Spatholobus suberectus]|nr:mitochondrial inner membrane [Spatholobus suberectus]